ncbi:NUDIX domain-containing protein [Candidatus Woesearchaeota archaeon]|nr:NUDIX domain-containing protein [Candidatus Woesearchaeota archaeon]
MRAAAIVLNDNKILLIHRFFKNREYYVFPGGGVEEGETTEEATIREMKEETSLDVKLDKKLWEIHNEFDGRTCTYYLITEFEGESALSGPEAEINSKENSFKLEWHKLDKIHKLNLVPEEVKKKVIEDFC